MPSIPARVLNRAMWFSKNFVVKNDASVAQMRRLFEAVYGTSDKQFARFYPNTEIEKFKISAIRAEWVKHRSVNSEEVICYIHGGGYVLGSAKSYRRFARRLSKMTKRKVLLFNYSLAPENPFPAGLNDCLTVYQWLLDQGYDGGKITVAGDSAGGGMSLALVQKIRDLGMDLPKAVVCLSPWTDLTLSGESTRKNSKSEVVVNPYHAPYWVNCYVGSTHSKDPLVSPLFADFHDFPPVLVHVSDSEAIFHDSTRLVEKLNRFGIDNKLEIYHKLPHAFHVTASFIPEAFSAFRNINEFLNEKHKTKDAVFTESGYSAA